MSRAKKLTESVKNALGKIYEEQADAEAWNTAREMGFHPAKMSDWNPNIHMVFDYGGKELIYDKGDDDRFTFTLEGDEVLSGDEFDLSDFKHWQTVKDAIK